MMIIAHITSLKAAISILKSQRFYAPNLIFDFGISGIPVSEEYRDDLGSYLQSLREQQLESPLEVMLQFKWHGKVIEYENATPHISAPEPNAVGVYPFWKVFLPAGFDPKKLETLSIEPFGNISGKKIDFKNEDFFKQLAAEMDRGWFTPQRKKEHKLVNTINHLIKSKPQIRVFFK